MALYSRKQFSRKPFFSLKTWFLTLLPQPKENVFFIIIIPSKTSIIDKKIFNSSSSPSSPQSSTLKKIIISSPPKTVEKHLDLNFIRSSFFFPKQKFGSQFYLSVGEKLSLPVLNRDGFSFLYDEIQVIHTYLIAGTDGVGTKLKITFETGIHETIRIDVVARSVNDIITSGSKLLFFLDYFVNSHP